MEHAYSEKRHSGVFQVGRAVFFAAMLVGIVAMIFLSAAYYAGSSMLSGAVIDERIDPNRASQASLMRLPSIGPVKAAAIVEYRQSIAGRAFKNACDLQNVRGIGPKTIEKIGPYLIFETVESEKSFEDFGSDGGMGN